MSTNRRTFLKTSADAAGALGLDALPKVSRAETASEPETSRPVERAAKSLNILILGGTGYTGPEQVNYALARGHKITLLNRNKTRPDLFKGKVDQLIGDLGRNQIKIKKKKIEEVKETQTKETNWVC